MSACVDLLELSTAHLPGPLVEDLASVPGVTATDTAVGWLMTVPEHPVEDTAAAAVAAIQDYARALGCAYVLLADDADRVDQLPVWP